MQFGAGDVEVRAIDPAVQRGADDRDRFTGAIEPEKRLPQLVIDAREAIRG